MQVDQSGGFDYSPIVNNSNTRLSIADSAAWVSKYVSQMVLTHDIIAKNLAGQPSMMYVSTDRQWTTSPECPGPGWGRCPLGTRTLLLGIWQQCACLGIL